MRINADITIFNKYIDASTRTEKFQRSQILAVAWESRKASNVRATGGQMYADQATVYIPFGNGTNYLDYVVWKALTVKTGKWTLAVGDIVVKGLVADEIQTGFTMTNLKAKYADVLTITSVDTMDSGSLNMRHWRIGLI